MERKLASIVKINDIQPIPNADAIEVATVKGWKVVVKKGEFKVNDLAVYFEIDSFLPVRPEFEFLRKSCFRVFNGQEGFRLKTIKLRNQLSQGLLIPVENLVKDQYNIEVGDDLTDALGIVKYEQQIPAQLSGVIEGLFPSFIPKTDEERIQNILEDYRGERVYITEKLDGTSFTCYYKDGKFGVCSRNYELKESEDNTHWKVARHFNIKEKMEWLGKNIALQGEIVGPGIQGNKYKLPSPTVFFFTGYNIDNRERITFNELESIVIKFNCELVPVLEYNMQLPTAPINLIEHMLNYAEGKSVLSSSTEREGVVVRGLDKVFSFKAISNKFLLKNEE